MAKLTVCVGLGPPDREDACLAGKQLDRTGVSPTFGRGDHDMTWLVQAWLGDALASGLCGGGGCRFPRAADNDDALTGWGDGCLPGRFLDASVGDAQHVTTAAVFSCGNTQAARDCRAMGDQFAVPTGVTVCCTGVGVNLIPESCSASAHVARRGGRTLSNAWRWPLMRSCGGGVISGALGSLN